MPKRLSMLIAVIMVLAIALSNVPVSTVGAESRTPAAFATPSGTQSAGEVTAYRMEVTLDSETRRLSGAQSIAWRNTTGEPQATIYLRLYPNADYYGEAETNVRDVTVDGMPVAVAPGVDPTVLAIPLGRTVAAGDRTTIALTFTTVVPLGSAGSFGIFQLDPNRATWSLADWYPIVAGWEASQRGWYLARPTAFGDPTFSETATYAVTITMPAGLELVGTGDTRSGQPTPEGMVTRTITTGPVRDFAMTLLPVSRSSDGTPDQLVQTERPVEGVQAGSDQPFTIRLSMLSSEAIPGLEGAILDAMAAALPIYAAWLGGLPEDELDIATTSLAGANGVSWAGLIWLDVGTIVADGALSDQERMGLTFVVTHEVGHQWIGGVIGSNSNDHGFMTEGLTNALAVEVLRELDGDQAAVAFLGGYVAGGYMALVRDGRDAVADAPITSETNGVIRGLVVYGKAALGFEAIRQELGNEAFREAIAVYAARFRFGISTPGDLRGVLVAAEGPGGDVQTLWRFWFEQEDATIADVDAVFAGAGT